MPFISHGILLRSHRSTRSNRRSSSLPSLSSLSSSVLFSSVQFSSVLIDLCERRYCHFALNWNRFNTAHIQKFLCTLHKRHSKLCNANENFYQVIQQCAPDKFYWVVQKPSHALRFNAIWTSKHTWSCRLLCSGSAYQHIIHYIHMYSVWYSIPCSPSSIHSHALSSPLSLAASLILAPCQCLCVFAKCVARTGNFIKT